MAYEWYAYGEREDGLRVQHSITRYLLRVKQDIPIGTSEYGIPKMLYATLEIKISKAEMRRTMKQGYYNYVEYHRGGRIEIPIHLSDFDLIKEEEVMTRIACPLTPEDVAAPKRKKGA